MRVLVVFDALSGDTKRIAEAIGAGISPPDTVAVENIAEAPYPDPRLFDLLIVGGPTQHHGLSPALDAWLARLGRRTLDGLPAAAFATRYRMSTLLSGSAAGGVAHGLNRAGCRLVVEPASFFVERDRPPSGEKQHGGAASVGSYSRRLDAYLTR